MNPTKKKQLERALMQEVLKRNPALYYQHKLHQQSVARLQELTNRGEQGEQGGIGKQGKDGITPVRGKDYFTPSDIQFIVQEVLKHIPMPKDGRDGISGMDGQDASIDTEALIQKIISKIPKPKDGKNAVNINEEKLTQAIIEKIRSEKLLDVSHIRNAESFLFNGRRYRFEELMHGGGAAKGSAFLGSQEKSTVAPNGVITTFPFVHTPALIMWNGAVQTLTDDYTVSGLSITFTASAGIPQTNDKIINVYG